MDTNIKIQTEILKKQAITHIWLYFILIPVIIGVVVGAIVSKFKPYGVKLTLIITTSVNLIYLIIVFLMFNSQDKPHIAIMVAVGTTVISNISAVISHKVACKLFKK